MMKITGSRSSCVSALSLTTDGGGGWGKQERVSVNKQTDWLGVAQVLPYGHRKWKFVGICFPAVMGDTLIEISSVDSHESMRREVTNASSTWDTSLTCFANCRGVTS